MTDFDPQYIGKVKQSLAEAICIWQVALSAGVVSPLVPAWASGTYKKGVVVTNNGKMYRCITPGISAGSGGPTGETSDITDGACHWAYVPSFTQGFKLTNTSGDPSAYAYIGTSSTLTASTASDALPAGVPVFMPYGNPSEFYLIAGSALSVTVAAGV